jgi:hypothetical protein
MSLAVFDIDGVVADVRHRLHYLDQRPKDWAGFFQGAGDDAPLAEGLALVADLQEKHSIVWLTGRPEWLRSTTADWLGAYGLPSGELFMRPSGDRRPARLYKVGVLRRLAGRNIAAFIDDDAEVVADARAAGYPAVLADWADRPAVLRDAQDRLGRT